MVLNTDGKLRARRTLAKARRRPRRKIAREGEEGSTGHLAEEERVAKSVEQASGSEKLRRRINGSPDFML